MQVVVRFYDPGSGRATRAWVRRRVESALEPWEAVCVRVHVGVRDVPGVNGPSCTDCSVRIRLPEGEVEAAARHAELETAVTRALARASLGVARRIDRPERRRGRRGRGPRIGRVSLR